MKLVSIAGFTNLGYRLHANSFVPLEANLAGKTAVVTGATGGIGAETALRLGKLGARVVVVARSPEKVASTVSGIPDAVGYSADLSLMSEIRRLADELVTNETAVDILVNNVGALFPSREVTGEGLERTLATNLAGHFRLTNLLVPQMSPGSRVINVSSGGMYAEKIRPDNLEFEQGRYRGAAAYARTKRGQVILTEMWAERFPGIAFHAMHPGWVATEGVRTSLPTFNRLMGPMLRDTEQGADTIVWLAAADEPAASSGLFWFDRRPVPTHLRSATEETPEDRAALWAELERLTSL